MIFRFLFILVALTVAATRPAAAQQYAAPLNIYDFRDAHEAWIKNLDFQKSYPTHWISPQNHNERWVQVTKGLNDAGVMITHMQLRALLLKIDSKTCSSTFSWYPKHPNEVGLFRAPLTNEEHRKHRRDYAILPKEDFKKLKELSGLGDEDLAKVGESENQELLHLKIASADGGERSVLAEHHAPPLNIYDFRYPGAWIKNLDYRKAYPHYWIAPQDHQDRLSSVAKDLKTDGALLTHMQLRALLTKIDPNALAASFGWYQKHPDVVDIFRAPLTDEERRKHRGEYAIIRIEDLTKLEELAGLNDDDLIKVGEKEDQELAQS